MKKIKVTLFYSITCYKEKRLKKRKRKEMVVTCFPGPSCSKSDQANPGLANNLKKEQG